MGAVLLRPDAPVKARGVRLRLHGEEFTHITRSTGKSTVTYFDRRPILNEEIVFAGEERLASFVEGVSDVWNTVLNRVQHTEIPAGEHRYPFAFSLPPDAPPTYDGSSAEVEYRLLANVDVPLWTDLRRRQDVMVYPRAQPVGFSDPFTARYPRPEGERGFWEGVGTTIRPKVQATLSVSRGRYGIGQFIDGTLTVEDTANAVIRGVEFTLVAREEARAKRQTDRVGREASAMRTAWPPDGGSGTAIPFELEVPAGLVPTLCRPHFSLEWFVRARLEIALCVDVSLWAPVTIVVGDGSV
jgi:hypothetical protein